MKTSTQATCFSALLLVLAAPPAWGAPTIGGCAKDVDKNAGKLTSAVRKEIAKIADSWEKLVVKYGAAPLIPWLDREKGALKAQGSFNKLFADDGKSVWAKTMIALADPTFGLIAKGKCDVSTLTALGMIPPVNDDIGDLWAKAVGASAVQSGIDQAMQSNGRAIGALVNFSKGRCTAGNPASVASAAACESNTTCNTSIATTDGVCSGLDTCESCQEYSTPVCKDVGSTWGSGSASQLVGAVPTTLDLSGSNAVTKYCKSDTLIGEDFLLIASGPAQPTRYLPIGALSYACVEQVRTQGYIDCTGSAGDTQISYATAANHTTAGACNLADDCGGLAEPATAGYEPGLNLDGDESRNPGFWFTSAPGLAGGGSALLVSSSKISTAKALTDGTSIATAGPDGVFCTPDDLNWSQRTQNPPSPTIISSGTSRGCVLNTDLAPGANVTSCVDPANKVLNINFPAATGLAPQSGRCIKGVAGFGASCTGDSDCDPTPGSGACLVATGLCQSIWTNWGSISTLSGGFVGVDTLLKFDNASSLKVITE